MSDGPLGISWLWVKFKAYFWTILIVPVLPLIGLIPAILAIVGLVIATGAQIDSMISSIDGLASQLHGAPSSAILSKVNRFIPLTEGIAMIVSLFTLRVASMAIRFILSWVPGR